MTRTIITQPPSNPNPPARTVAPSAQPEVSTPDTAPARAMLTLVRNIGDVLLPVDKVDMATLFTIVNAFLPLPDGSERVYWTEGGKNPDRTVRATLTLVLAGDTLWVHKATGKAVLSKRGKDTSDFAEAPSPRDAVCVLFERALPRKGRTAETTATDTTQDDFDFDF